MKTSKGFNFSIRTVMIVTVGVIAALVIMSFLNDGTGLFSNFTNRTVPEGGFVGQP
ncbi:hypothetical protein ACK3SF_00535 [Candidatus Nanosalina sp. VS9-1]|uniref:hypothetical protein n=1 Tax=Candidatus Nanosalina sp. VS9-1 TaxID=3388566 RepID=UPI0039E17E78